MDPTILNVEALDIPLLDRVVRAMYAGSTEEREFAMRALGQLRAHPQAWTKVDAILEQSTAAETKYFALQMLDAVITTRWKVLPRDQCEGLKNYIVSLVIKLSSDAVSLKRDHLLLSKLNVTLVNIIKQDWPRHWENFIPEIVGASKTNEALCENNMAILQLLSEEVFDFSRDKMTQQKIKELKTRFNKEFELIYSLCESVLMRGNEVSASLVSATLATLLRFLNWIPLGFIFETNMIEILLVKFFPQPAYRNVTLKCLSEIGSLSVDTHDSYFFNLFNVFLVRLRETIPPDTNIAKAYEAGTSSQQDFISDLALFFCGFLRAHLALLERTPGAGPLLLEAHGYLLQISCVDDVEIFKIALEHWNSLTSDLYHETPQSNPGLMLSSPRRILYAPILSRLRLILIGRMARPEEVLIREDENGDIVREYTRDTDAITLYKSMRETLIFLTHLDHDDTQHIMLDKLAKQVDGSEWSFHNLNTLCWAIGSISGAQNEEMEKRFLVTVIKDLLGMCEQKRGKDNKAVIASNIMYIVGQYPRFLRAHWRFLKTVVNKLFEFMHESHPGVQDMAVETFLKIAQKCKRKFVVQQPQESLPFVEEIIAGLHQIISDLENPQMHIFYEGVACMLSANADARKREALIARLMQLPNASWAGIMQQAAQAPTTLQESSMQRNVINIIKTNERVCQALQHSYMAQLGAMYLDLLNVFKYYSQAISAAVAELGERAVTRANVKQMQATKKELLKLVDSFVRLSDDAAVVRQNFVPPLLDVVLFDYKNSLDQVRDADIISLLSTLVSKLQGLMISEVPRMLEAVFESTLAMITKNFEDYPEHRQNFFQFISLINQHCFPAFLSMSAGQFKVMVDSMVWAFKHTERQVSETGLSTVLLLLQSIERTGEARDGFYKAFFVPLLHDVFFVLTDTFHKSAFKLHATILLTLLKQVSAPDLAPLWDAAAQPPPANNLAFVHEHVLGLLVSSFPNLARNQLHQFVLGLFQRLNDLDAFKTHLRDFLVKLKEFSGEDDEAAFAELYIEEREAQARAQADAAEKAALAIPGMVPPNKLPFLDDANTMDDLI